MCVRHVHFKCAFRMCVQIVYSVFSEHLLTVWNARSKCVFRIFIHSVFRMFIQTVFFQNVRSECDYSAHTSVTLGKCVWGGSLYCGDGWGLNMTPLNPNLWPSTQPPVTVLTHSYAFCWNKAFRLFLGSFGDENHLFISACFQCESELSEGFLLLGYPLAFF